MYRTLLILSFVPLLLTGQSKPKGDMRPVEPPARRTGIDAGRIGSIARRPLAPQVPAPEYPPAIREKKFAERPQAKPFNGEISEELTIGSEFQTPVFSADGLAEPEKDDPDISAPPRNDPRASLTTPSNGSTLSPVTAFAWTPGSQADRYWLTVGSCGDCADIADRDMGLNRSTSVSIPADGRVIYATIFTQFGGAWFWQDYQFRAASVSSATAAALTSPSNGSTLSTPQVFTWNTGSGVDLRWFNVGSCSFCGDIADEEITGRSSLAVNLPQDGRTIFVTVWSLIQGDWYTREYQFRAPSAVTRTVRVNLTNHLRYAVDVSVNDRVMGSVPAGETRFVDATVSTSLTVSWDLVRPTLSGRALGDPMGGRYNTIANPSGTYNFTVDYVVGDSQFFRPLLTNRSSVALLMEANGGLSAQNRCDCTAAAGSTSVHSGYYRLYSNSNFRVYRSGNGYTGTYFFWGTNSDGRVSGSGELWRNVAAGSGEITFTTSTAP